jgi:5-methylcytosine-specific restriction protein A
LSKRIFENVYHTTRWEKLRKIRLMIEPLCRECMKSGIVAVASIVDHIIPIRQGGDPWSLDNTQSLCEKCHNKKRRKERDDYK